MRSFVNTRLGALAIGAGVLGVGSVAPEARAQEAIVTEAATQPSKGLWAVRVRTFATRLEGNGRDVFELKTTSRLSYGVSRTVSVSADIPVIVQDDLARGGADGDDGLGDVSLSLKWRFWQKDTGGLDTTRLALIAGTELPTGHADLSSHSVDPFLGGVFTLVRGRLGFNQAVRYQVNTGTDRFAIAVGQSRADLLEFDSAVLWRLHPDEFEADSAGGLYLTTELEGFYETNGDTEILLTPGLLWEGRLWAGEIGVRIPVSEDVRYRAPVEFGVVAGLRFLF